MNTNELVRIFRNGGIVINKINGHYFNRQGWINYSFPLLDVIPAELIPGSYPGWKYLISVFLTSAKRKNTYEFILETDSYIIENFDKKIRNRIRKSLQNCEFKRPSLEDMIGFGLKINQSTFSRQQRKDKTLTDTRHWTKYIQSLYLQDDFIFLGAYYANRMVAYIIVYEFNGKYIIQHAFIDRQDADVANPMNGLIYTLVNQLIKQKGSIRITYGLESFNPLPDLNRFKSNMLFERIPVSRIYLINPLILPLIKFMMFYIIQVLKRRSIRSSLLQKMIRLYQGHRLYFRECNTYSQQSFKQMEQLDL